MSLRLLARAILIAASVACLEGDQALGSDEYHAVTLVDVNNPLSPAWLQQAGVDYLYASAPPLEVGEDGRPAIAAGSRDAWEQMLALYGDTGVKVLLMRNFYIKPAEEHEAVDVFGRKHPMACFRHPGFQQAMTGAIQDLIAAFSDYPAFGGFVFDDGPHVRVDCCYCPQCVESFRQQHGVEPPGFKPHDETGRVSDRAPVLLWEQFQQESWQIYLRTQSSAVRSVEGAEGLLMITIPSDSYFYGRFLGVDMAREESPLGHGARLQRIERIQVRDWTIFQSFPLSRLPEADERGLQRWATGAHITAQSPKMLMQTEGPYAPTYGRLQYMSPAEIERMGRVTLTEGAGSICYWTSAQPLPSYPAAFDAMSEIKREVDAIGDTLQRRRQLPASIGLVYSTTTEVMEQPWERNTADRWRHLHAFEGLAYSLRRSNIPFEIVMESDITADRLRGFRALILPSVRYLSESAAQIIEDTAAHTNLQVLGAGECLPLRGMVLSACDPLIWHNWARRGYRQERYANLQWQEARSTLIQRLLPLVEAPVRVYSERAIGQAFSLGDGDLLLMVTSWDLDDICEVAVEGEGTATDMLSGRDIGPLNDLGRITVPPAGWRVLRITP